MPDQVRHDKVRVLFCRVINFGEREIEIKRKVKDFDEDLQDEFGGFFNPEYPVNPVKKVSLKELKY